MNKRAERKVTDLNAQDASDLSENGLRMTLKLPKTHTHLPLLIANILGIKRK